MILAQYILICGYMHKIKYMQKLVDEFMEEIDKLYNDDSKIDEAWYIDDVITE